MKGLVSKVRTRTTKTREKQASKASSEKLPLKQSPFTGMAIAMLLWILSVVTIATEETFTSPGGRASFLPLAGMSLLLLVSLLGTGLGLKIVKPKTLKQNSRILLISLISILSLASVRAVLFVNTQFAFLSDDLIIFIIPLCITPLLTTILLGSKTGIVTGCWNSIAISFLMGGDFRVLLIGMITTIVSAQAARNVKTRTKVIKTGLLLGLCKIILVFSETAVNWQTSEVSTVLHQAITCIVGGLLSAIVVLILLPLFESLFRITTNITLFELADLGHPLLQRLAIEAPGTYHHSLVVANLAQAAADEIEANSLLTRICSYFHDVGKLTKPDFFAENIQLEENPHDNLPPSMSTLVITAHVKEGLSLAILNKLPPPILDVIREHHGTSLLSYFHHKAKSQLEFELGQAEDASQNGQSKLDEGDFR
jgi:putative nucleotidyltransferase with HDIG domain